MRLKPATATKVAAADDGLATVVAIVSTTDLRRYLARFLRFGRMEFVHRLFRVCEARPEVCRRPWHGEESSDFRLFQQCLRRSTLLSACIHCWRYLQPQSVVSTAIAGASRSSSRVGSEVSPGCASIPECVSLRPAC